MHRQAIRLVCAKAQAAALVRIQDELTAEEADVVRRARNVHQSPPKNADPADYQKATGLEALIGYLYAAGREERLGELLKKALPPEMIGEA
jgi:ribonuclease-3 family protein